MKKITVCIVIISFIISIFNIVVQNIDNKAILSMINIDNLAYGEVTVIPARNNVDAPQTCKTTKLVQVSVGDGKFEWKSISVTGLENPCKPKDNSTCFAYACYSN